VFSKKYGDAFYVRIDRHPQQGRYEQELLEDIQAFGFKPDKVILQRERESRYQEVVDQILEGHKDAVYFCDCSVSDITFRATRGSQMEFLHREEKYPRPCNIASISLFGPENSVLDLAQEAKVAASISHRDHPPENLIDGRTDTFWTSKEVGYLGEILPEITLHWPQLKWLSEIEITYQGFPLRGLEIKTPEHSLAEVSRSGSAYWWSSRKVETLRERIIFPPVFTNTLILSSFRYFFEVKKEYFYDGYCRHRNLRLPLRDRNTTLRIKDVKAWWLPDVAIWFDGAADLCITSLIDDHDFGIELRVRGSDIEPFTLLEGAAAELLGWKIPNYFHTMLCDENSVKYSKFIHSPRAVELTQEFSSAQILSLLARKSGILKEPGSFSLPDLVQACDLRHLQDVRLPILLSYSEMVKELRS